MNCIRTFFKLTEFYQSFQYFIVVYYEIGVVIIYTNVKMSYKFSFTIYSV